MDFHRESDESPSNRREFLARTCLAAAAVRPWLSGACAAAPPRDSLDSRIGLVTYLWGRDWDLATLLANCAATGLMGVELRTEHAHGVEPSISAEKRLEIRKQFADSAVTLVGLGTNEHFDSPDPPQVRRCLQNARAFIKLSHDIGASGVKVKPNDLHDDVPRERTIAQIGRALRILGDFGANYGQQIRLEAHGSCAPLDIMREILLAADHPNVRLCWNSNEEDLQEPGLGHNFSLVKDYLGATCHVHESRGSSYPYQELMRLLLQAGYAGWLLLECSSTPADRLAAMRDERQAFEDMIATARRESDKG